MGRQMTLLWTIPISKICQNYKTTHYKEARDWIKLSLVLTRSPPPSPLSHLILNGQQKPHGRRAQWMRHKRSGIFCVLSGQDAKKLRRRQSYRYGQVQVRWHDQLELSGKFCVLSGHDSEKLRKRESYHHGQGHVRWRDQLELSQHVLLSAGIWPNALRSCVQTTSRHLFSVVKDSRNEWDYSFCFGELSD